MMATQKLHPRSDIHIARKIWHCCGVLAITYIFNRFDRATAIQLMLFFTIMVLLVDYLRLRSETWNKWAMVFMAPFMRDSEKNNYSGLTPLALGVLLIILLFPPKVVLLSLFFLAFADPLASYFGIRYGKDKLFGHKSLQGTMAAFVVCFIISAIYFVTQGIMTERLVVVSLISALVGAFSEVVPIRGLDDNFILPVLSSSLLWVVFNLFGGF
jgi:diacylglycerol kinase (CTP)